jgi:hypothetical protein
VRKGTLVATAAATVAALTATTASASAATERFSFMGTISNGSYSVIATGAFTDGGTARVRNGHGKLWLRDGTITLKTRHHKPKVHVDQTSCVGEVTESGTYTLVGGTGAYKGIHGSGTLEGHYTAVGRKKDGACSMTTHPAAAQLTLIGRGPITLPDPMSQSPGASVASRTSPSTHSVTYAYSAKSAVPREDRRTTT